MFQLDPFSNIPIYEQLARKIKENIIKEYLKAGDSLPSVRKMARELNVTPNTVQKAYRFLEQEKVIMTVPGKGAFIADHMPEIHKEEKAMELIEQMKPIIMELIYLGLTKEEITEAISKMYEGMKEEER